MTNRDFEDIKEAAKIIRGKYPELREGQSFFNVLNRSEPDIAKEIKGTSLDMFDNDDNIEVFKKHYVGTNS